MPACWSCVKKTEVSQILATMPLWATQKTEVIPLESFEERQAMHRQFAERLKAASS